MLERVKAIGKHELGGLREHLLGCPRALAACAPALPIFDRREDLLRQFRVAGGGR